MRIRTFAALLGRTALATTAVIGTQLPAHAQSPEASKAFDIPAGPLHEALTHFAEQAGVQLIYAPQVVAGRWAPAVSGILAPKAVLQRLLGDSGIAVTEIDKNVFMLGARRQGAEAAGGGVGGDGNAIVVTGSRIRGAGPVGSPSRTMTQEEMRQGGYGSVAQALQALPGNFGGRATEQSALNFADRSGTNLTLGSGVNLRGLGPDATLVLVNGRRIAGAGLMGDFADISSIPMNALDRVEIVTDGASAIYGSDAVAGVVNIVLKRDFEGLQSDARLGGVTRGNARELRLSQVAGTRWATGSVLVSYEFQKRTALHSRDRDFARSADLRPFGGTDQRLAFSLPGNILGFDPASGGLVPQFAIPSGQNGTALTPGDFLADTVNLDNIREGTDLSPKQTRHSVFATATQEMGDRVTITVEGRYAHRAAESCSSGYATIFSITPANPWFVSPTGAPSDLIGYAFTQELGATRNGGKAQSLGFTGALDIALGGDWKVAAYGAWASQRDTGRTDGIVNEYALAEALGNLPDDPLTPYSPAVDGYFNPYGNGLSNGAPILAAIGGFTQATTRSRILTGDVIADGPLLGLPGGQVKLAVGGNFRRETFQSRSLNLFFSAVPEPGTPADYGRNIWAGFAELNVPLIGAANAVPGIDRLDIAAAVRTEDYGDFGSTTNPKISVRWAPTTGIALRASWGTSFRAPNLRELQAATTVGPSFLTNANGSSLLVLQQSGGNSGLVPERARSWTVGLDLEPQSLAGFTASLTAFRTIFDRRIDAPALRNFSRALTDASLAPFIRFVSPGTNSEDRAYLDALVASTGGNLGGYPVAAVAAVIDTRFVNTGKVDVAGADIDLGYRFSINANRFHLGLSATWLARWREQLTPAAPSLDRRNLVGNPVDLRGRLTGGWSRGSVDTSFAVNWVDRYRDIDGSRIAGWATVDLRIAYQSPRRSGPLSETTIALSAQNLFDRAPPFYNSPTGAGYDAANADATGRYVALELTKRW